MKPSSSQYTDVRRSPIQFYLIVISGFLALSGFFRLLGTMCRNYDQAARLAAVIITIMCVWSVTKSSA